MKVTCVCLRDKEICNVIEKKLPIDILGYFSVYLSYGVISDGVANLEFSRLYNENTNFRTLYYEVVSSPFILWKFYLDILARIILNHCDKYITPALLPGRGTDDCQKCTVGTPASCSGLKKNIYN